MSVTFSQGYRLLSRADSEVFSRLMSLRFFSKYAVLQFDVPELNFCLFGCLENRGRKKEMQS